ncbi:hypothetical protein QQ045_003305 [Rhodiola kirilowii]
MKEGVDDVSMLRVGGSSRSGGAGDENAMKIGEEERESETAETCGSGELLSETIDVPRAGDNISVTIRFRPLSDREFQRGDEAEFGCWVRMKTEITGMKDATEHQADTSMPSSQQKAKLREAASLGKHVLLKNLIDSLESLKAQVAGRNKDEGETRMI